MYRARLKLVFYVQVLTLNLSYLFHRILRVRRPKDIEWIVGPYEVATLVHNIAKALPSARSVVLARHPFYTLDYDWEPSARIFPGSRVVRAWLLGPAKLGQVAARAEGFIYLSAEGFVNAAYDQRQYEFRFLKRRGCKIVCYFTGNDIRSPKLMKELELSTGMPNLGTYLGETDRIFATDSYDDLKRAVADAANRYADKIFNADVDQRGYFTRETHPFLYFFPDEEIAGSFEKFSEPDRLVVVHAPSSPILKGTPLVRAAVAQLREEGYDFEYVELIRVTNDEVKRSLTRAHISLNEFYASVPGVFGVESMAAGCALLTSADEAVERQLPPGSNDAWMVTAHHQVVTNLRTLLDHPERMEPLARRGNEWVRRHAAISASSAELTRALRDD